MRFRRHQQFPDPHAAAQTIASLTAGHREIVAAYEVERRRIERDLHDGTQQYLVAANMMIGEARLSASVGTDPELAKRLAEAQQTLQKALDSLRITVRGIHPHILS